jgi:hypothetical protein
MSPRKWQSRRTVQHNRQPYRCAYPISPPMVVSLPLVLHALDEQAVFHFKRGKQVSHSEHHRIGLFFLATTTTDRWYCAVLNPTEELVQGLERFESMEKSPRLSRGR